MCRDHVAKVEVLIDGHEEECKVCRLVHIEDSEDNDKWLCPTGMALRKLLDKAEEHDANYDSLPASER